MPDALDADWRESQRENAVCHFTVGATPESVALIKAMLDPAKVLSTGCKVIRHADCCALCRANEKCERLPLHPNCRCKRSGTLTAGQINSIE